MPELIECSSCGTELVSHAIRCPTCGKTTAYFHRQRRCLHCGAPAAEKAKTCMMCHQPVDSLPLSTSIFSGSWLGIGLGVVIIVGIVMWVTGAQTDANAVAQIVETNTPTATPTLTPTPTNTGTPTPTPTITPTLTPTPRIHTVESGETLVYIAQRYGVTVDELAKLNNIQNIRALSVGQTLIVPPEAEPVVGNNDLPPQMVYVIQEGDNLSSIAFEIGTPMEAIVAANPGLNLDLIYPGQEIVVPLSTPTATATATATTTATPTATPPYVLPNLLRPANEQVIEVDVVMLNWTSTGLLADDEFYVVELTWPDGITIEHWAKNSSWRISRDQLPVEGVIIWNVAIKRQSGTASDGTSVGQTLTQEGSPRSFEWR